MKIIDVHTHPFITEEESYCFYKENTKITTESAKTTLENAGIQHICGSVITNDKYTMEKGFSYIKFLNDEALKIKGIYGDYYTPGFHIHPAFVKESKEVIEWMHENGHRLIGELVPYMHGWSMYGMDYGSKELSDILDLAGKYNMILSYHTMSEWNDETDRMIESHPEVTFIAAHPNDFPYYKRQLERLKKYPNLYLDLSGTGMFRYGMLKMGVETVGSEKILFGTDFPICNPRMYVQAVLGEELSEEAVENIYHKNAERIFGF